MNNRRIHLTEDELKRVVNDSVKQIITEGFGDFMRGAFGKVKNDVTNTARRGAENLRNKVSNVAQNAQNYYNDVKQAGTRASNKADAQRAINVIADLQRKGILGKNIANMVIGNLRKYGNQ